MILEGKIIDFLGDSITEGVGVADRANNRFDNVIKRDYSLAAVYNYGVGGSRLAHQSVPSEKPRHDLCFCGRAYDLNPNADIIVVYGGINDYIHGDAPIGKIGDKTPATFCGAVYFLMNFLKTTYTNSKIVFITPAKFKSPWTDYRYPSKDFRKKPDAQPARYYGEVIMETAKQFDIPVLDFFEVLPFDVDNEDVVKKYTSDCLHFNDEGHKVLAKTIGDFLLSL